MQTARTPLHVAFTMDCEPAATRWAPTGPKGWERSGRSIYAFCRLLLSAGYPATLFLAPLSADMHAPLAQELAAAGIEMGLLLQPQTLEGAAKRFLGQLGRDQQREVIDRATRAFELAVGTRPRSVRSAMFSASDDTFPLLREHGLVQGSLSSPGRRVAKHAAVWTGAPQDPHYVDATNRLRAGSFQFLEVPVTADSARVVNGLSSDLQIERGAFDTWHRPLLESQLARMERGHAPFRLLCSYTSSVCAYDVEDAAPTATLHAMLTYLDGLRERYDVRPITIAAAHTAFRQAPVASPGKDSDP